MSYCLIFDDENEEIEYKKKIIKKLNIKEKYYTSINYRDIDFFDKIKKCNFNDFEKNIKCILLHFGTSLMSNRMAIGEIIQIKCSDVLKQKLDCKNLPDEKRYDLEIHEYEKISVKYSSTGSIKLINSLGENKDVKLKPTIIFTPLSLYFLSYRTLKLYGINSNDYIKNTKDGAKLDRNLLKLLDTKKYYFKLDIKLEIDKDKCKNFSISDFLIHVIPWDNLREKYKRLI